MYSKIDKVVNLDNYKKPGKSMAALAGAAASGIIFASDIQNSKNNSKSSSNNKKGRTRNINKRKQNRAKTAAAGLGLIASFFSIAGDKLEYRRNKRNRSRRLYRMIQSGEIDISDALNYYDHESNKDHRRVVAEALKMAGVDIKTINPNNYSNVVGDYRKNRT